MLVASCEMLNVALNGPTLPGVHVMLNTQLPAGAMLPPQASVTLKTPALAPVILLLTIATVVPVFCRVLVSGAEVAGGSTVPKSIVVPEAGVAIMLGELITVKVAAVKLTCPPMADVTLPTGKLML